MLLGARARAGDLEEVLQQLVAALGGDRFGVELSPMPRPAAVREAHDLIVLGPSGDFEFIWQTVSRHRQAVIAGGDETVRHACKEALTPMPDGARLAMHDRVRMDHLASKGLADGLMSQAYPKNWQAGRGDRDELQAHAGLVGRARPWREHHSARTQGEGLAGAPDVVALHARFSPQLVH